MTTSSSDQSRTAVMEIPGASSSSARRKLPCAFRGMQGRRLHLELGESVKPSTPVSIEYEDALFLGEVMVCSPNPDTWAVEVKVEQILTGLQSLMALRAGLLNEGVPQALTLMPAGVLN